MSPATEPCASATTQDACAAILATAAQQGDRETVGALLTAAAAWQPDHLRIPVARAAAWLAPTAWAPSNVLQALAAEPLPPSSPPPPKGSTLAFRGATAEGKHVVPVDLSIPKGDGPFAGRQLASTLALATGAYAASFGHDSDSHVIAAAPLLERITALPIVFEPASLEAASLCGKADRALRDGARTEAFLLLGDAVESLPSNAAPCRTTAPLHYLRWTLAGLAHAGTGTTHYEDLRKVCLDAKVPDDEAEARTYFAEVSSLQLHRGTEVFALPREWIGPASREAYRARTEALATRWGDRRADLLRALRDQMLDRTQPAGSVCDVDFHARWTKSLQASQRRLAALGREDLALPLLSIKAGPGGFVVEGVEELHAWVQRPEHRWVRVPALLRGLAAVEYASPSPQNAEILAPICKAAHGEVLEEIAADRREGFEARNVVRMFALFRGAAVCGPPDAFADVADSVLAAATTGPEGKFGVWTTLGLSTLEIAAAGLDKRIPQALMSGLLLRGAMQRMRSKLGSSDEDVVLDASLGLLLAGIDRYTAERGDFSRTLDGAIRRLDPIVPRAKEAGSPKLVRYAPAVHLVAHALLVAAEASSDNPDRRDMALARLDRVLDKDVKIFLDAQGIPQHADSVVKLVRSLSTTLRAQGNASQATAALSGAKRAIEHGSEETGWWSVGLNLGRLLTLDLAVYSAMRANPKASLAEELVLSDRVLEALATNATRDFAKSGRGLEALHLLPAVHRGLVAGLLLEDDERWGAALDAAGEASHAALERISSQGASDRELGFLALLVDALRLAHEDGGPRRVVEDKSARRRWASKLSDRTRHYPAELSLVGKIAAGVGAYEQAPEEAKNHFQMAAALADEANPRNVPYLPRLVEAAVLHRIGDTAGAALAVDEILAHGKEARSCGVAHEVDALLPFRAWAAERLGRHQQGDAALRTFLERTELFSGQSKLHCRLVSQRPSLTFHAEASQLLGQLFFQGEKSEGSLQSGIGFGKSPHNEDRLFCTVVPVLGERPDMRLTTHLTRAVYAFRAGEDPVGHRALEEAVVMARRFRHADDVTVGFGERLTWDLAKKDAYLGQIAWGAAVVRARGYVASADALDEFIRVASSVERDVSLVSVLERDSGAPSAFDQLGFDAAGPWVRASWGAKVDSDAASLRRIPTGEGASALKPLHWVLLAAQVDPSPTSVGRARLRTMRPATPLDRVLVERVRARLDARDGRSRKVLSEQDIQVLAEAGLPYELVPVVLEAVAGALGRNDEPGATRLLDIAQRSVRADTSPLARADLLAGVFGGWPRRAETIWWAEAMEEVHEALEGRVKASEEVALLHAAARQLGREGAHGKMGPVLLRLQTLMGRALGEHHPQTLAFASAALAVRVAGGQDGSREAGVLLAALRKEAAKGGRVDSRVTAFLEAASGSGGGQEARALLGAIPPL
jgi:hypothetical protein